LRVGVSAIGVSAIEVRSVGVSRMRGWRRRRRAMEVRWVSGGRTVMARRRRWVSMMVWRVYGELVP